METKAFENMSLNNMDGETWVDVFGYSDMYEVSSYGRVRGKQRMDSANRYTIHPKIIKCVFRGSGTATIMLANGSQTKSIALSKIVVQSFLGGHYDEFVKKGECIHHIDFDKSNNKISNLKIISIKDVRKLAYRAGLLKLDKFLLASNESKKIATDKLNVYSSGKIIGRICSRCFIEKPIDEYYKTGANRRYCYHCHLVAQGVVNVGRNKKKAHGQAINI
jgi:hypothetical protein